MWRPGSRKHPTDECLLALADGECAPAQERKTRAHLAACWQCRGRLAELEEAAGEAGKLLAPERYPQERLRSARRALEARLAEFETASLPAPAFRLPRFGLALAAGLAVCAFALGAWFGFGRPPLRLPAAPRPAPKAFTPPARAVPLDPAPLPLPSLRLPLVMPSLPAQTVPAPPTLDEIEMEARYALHRADACLGEPVEVRVEAGLVQVSGVVASRRRRREIEAELAAVPSAAQIRVKLEAIEDLALETPAGSLPQQEPAVVEQHGLPVEEILLEEFVRRKGMTAGQARAEVVRISQLVIQRGEEMIDQAWALRKLGRRYGAASLPAASQRLLYWMAREHVAGIERKLGALENLVGGVASQPAPGEGGGAPAGWPEWVEAEFVRVQKVHRLCLGLYSGSGLDGMEPRAAAEALRARLGEARQGLEGWESRLAWRGPRSTEPSPR